MSHNELLNNISHQALSVYSGYSAELGDSIASTVTFLTEFSEVQKEYPILFRKVPEKDTFQAVALFGIQKDENLFLKETGFSAFASGWAANYIPAAVARGPFSIAYQTRMENGKETREPLINVDMDHPKIDHPEGLRVFKEQGGNSEYLEKVSSILNLIRDGMALNDSMFDAYQKYELIENVTIDIDLVNQDKHQISGFYTIDTGKLAELSGKALEELNKAGFLQAAYFVIASLANIKKLIDLKNTQLEAAKT